MAFNASISWSPLLIWPLWTLDRCTRVPVIPDPSELLMVLVIWFGREVSSIFSSSSVPGFHGQPVEVLALNSWDSAEQLGQHIWKHMSAAMSRRELSYAGLLHSFWWYAQYLTFTKVWDWKVKPPHLPQPHLVGSFFFCLHTCLNQLVHWSLVLVC